MSRTIVAQTLERFFRPLLSSAVPGAARRERILVAFSGGADSTALLAGLAAVAPRLGVEVHAAHLDHGLDPDSRRRARAAERLAAELGAPFHCQRLERSARAGSGGVEAVARRARYAFLERRSAELGASFVATAHHADDQAETVLLRLVFGSGLEGLAGIRPQRPLGEAGRRLVRPLLGLRRRELAASLAGLVTVSDPTNDDLAVARNRIRRVLLPYLEEGEPGTAARLARVARAAAAVRGRLDEALTAHLAPRPVPGEPGVRVARAAFGALPEGLLVHALAFLHRRAGAPYPAGAAARRELLRQMGRSRGRGERIACDCGGGWRWEAASGLLQLVQGQPPATEFAYTLEVPGEVEIPELGLVFRLRRGEIDPWMFATWPDRTGLADFSPEVRRIEVRSRRPGDRLTPLGASGRRRLKDLLIDRRVPRRQRGRLPLLVVDGEVAWVPGVALDERFRLRGAALERAWIAELEPLGDPSGTFRV